LPSSAPRGPRAPAAARVGQLAALLLALTVSTREVFLERLAGCPIGGRH
jgi:hypothetical protein